MKCEGACSANDECIGDAVLVSVMWNDEPIEFWYCQTAIKEDRERGFEVTIKED